MSHVFTFPPVVQHLAVHSAPPFSVAQKASEKIAAMMDESPVMPSALARTFLTHLAKIEEIEARLGREDVKKEEMEHLAILCHQILNEVQELHIHSYVENAYVHHKADSRNDRLAP